MAARPAGGIEVTGLQETISAAKAAEREWGKAVLREIRGAINPIRNDARSKFEALGGTGPRVARTVRVSVSTKGAGLSVGGSGVPYALGREFGAKRKATRPFRRGGSSRAVVARIPYGKPSIFGPWTGNQFDIGERAGRLTFGEVSGRAFYPAIGEGAEKVYDALGRVADRTVAMFPGPVSAARVPAPNLTAAPTSRLQQFLASGGL